MTCLVSHASSILMACSLRNKVAEPGALAQHWPASALIPWREVEEVAHWLGLQPESFVISAGCREAPARDRFPVTGQAGGPAARRADGVPLAEVGLSLVAGMVSAGHPGARAWRRVIAAVTSCAQGQRSAMRSRRRRPPRTSRPAAVKSRSRGRLGSQRRALPVRASICIHASSSHAKAGELPQRGLDVVQPARSQRGGQLRQTVLHGGPHRGRHLRPRRGAGIGLGPGVLAGQLIGAKTRTGAPRCSPSAAALTPISTQGVRRKVRSFRS